MTRSVKGVRKLLALVPLVVALIGPWSVGACTSGALVPAGGECLLATDCEQGLVCVPSGGKRVCSADLTNIVSTVDAAAGGDAVVPDATLDAIKYDAPVDSPPPPKDQGVPDTSNPPDTGAPDTGGSQDSGGGG